METIKVDLENCTAVYPNNAKLFDFQNHQNESDQEVDCFLGYGVSYAIFQADKDGLKAVNLFRKDGSLVSLAKLLEGENRVNHYWKHQFISRDYNGNDPYKPSIERTLVFYNFIIERRNNLKSRDECLFCPNELWCEFYDRLFQVTKESKFPALDYPAIELELNEQSELRRISFTLTARLTNMNQYLLHADFDKGILRSIVDAESKHMKYIEYPTDMGKTFYIQGPEKHHTSHKADREESFAIEGFKEFWSEGKRVFRIYTNLDVEENLKKEGVFLREQRKLLCDDERMIAWLPTVNFHIKRECNMKCRHCFAEFNDMDGEPISLEDARAIIKEIASIPAFKKITFSGGEPTLYKGIDELLKLAHDKGLKTSIVTNGSIISQDDDLLKRIATHTDIFSFSIDSFNNELNRAIGRYYSNEKTLSFEKWQEIIHKIRSTNKNITIKINTVVTKINYKEKIDDEIEILAPERWKILKMMDIEGQHDENASKEIVPTDNEFNVFVKNNRHNQDWIVVEGENSMVGSYIMIAPDGTLFNNIGKRHSYSKPILSVGIIKALESTPMIRSAFFGRKGEY